MKAMLVDDEARRAPVDRIRELLRSKDILVDAEYEFLGKIGADDFCSRVRRLDRPPDIAVIDFSLRWKDLEGGEWNGDRVARFLREHWEHDVPFFILFVSSYLRSMATPYEQLVDLLRVPFAGFVELGPGWEDDVLQQVRWACNLVRAEKARAIAALAAIDVDRFFGDAIVGRASSLVRAGYIAARVSGSNATVLITGESGTGKELIAEAIHKNGSRKNKPFVKQNCAALNDNVLESELFGHTRGAFTGAIADKKGLFKIADGGTLFLDEVGEMPLNMQAKLLRVVEEMSFRPMGAVRDEHVDVRIIAATHRNLREMVAAGGFREDLFYRLNVCEVPMPPLRERGGDVLDLADHFLSEAANARQLRVERISLGAQRALRNYGWPGNIRELRNAVQRGVLMCDGDTVDLDHLPDSVHDPGKPPSLSPQAGTWREAEEEFKRAFFTRVLEECQGNITRAAKKAEVSREHFSKTVRQLDINFQER